MKYDPITQEWIADENSAEATSFNNIQQCESQLKKIERQRKNEKQIDEEINQNEFYSYAKRLTNYIKEMTDANDFNKIVFRNRNGSYYNHKTRIIVIGYYGLNEDVERGFWEYKSVQHVWIEYGHIADGYHMKKKQAVWALILHEFAHYLQRHDNGRSYGSVHNENFKSQLRMLIDLFPYKECENI